jgi:hypothetical protein
MTLQLIHSEFPYKFNFLFLSVHRKIRLLYNVSLSLPLPFSRGGKEISRVQYIEEHPPILLCAPARLVQGHTAPLLSTDPPPPPPLCLLIAHSGPLSVALNLKGLYTHTQRENEND